MLFCAAKEQLLNRRKHMLTWDETTVSGLPRIAGVFAQYQIVRRSGGLAPFEPNRIAHAMTKACMPVHGAMAFAQRTCSGWLLGLWRAIKPSKVSAHSVDLAIGLDSPFFVAAQRGQSRQQRFFGSSKPDMRNAP
jgi:hypothetical protein